MLMLIAALAFAQATSPHEAAWVGVDKVVAKKLRDPTSVIQYAVTPPFTCPGEADQKMFSCICWRMNGKNAMGAYSGVQEYLGKAYPFEVGWLVMGGPLKTAGEVFMCGNAGYVDRDGAKIAEQVK